MKRVTQSQIAKVVGCSKSTVSRALAGDPRILAETTARIRAAAEKLDYRPDPALAALVGARWHNGAAAPGVTLAFISQFRQPHAGRDNLNRQGAEARAKELGYHLDHFFLDDHPDAKALERILVSRGIRGLMIANFFDQHPALALDWNRFCAVACAGCRFLPPLHVLENDVFRGLLLTWRKVLEYGYRRPGFVIMLHAPPLIVEDDDLRRAAALLCLDNINPDDRVPPLYFTYADPEKVRVARLIAWYRRWKPDAVIGFNPAIMDTLRKEAQVRIPEKTGFVRLVTSGDPSEERDKNTAGIKANAIEVGRATVDLLNVNLRTNQWGLPSFPIRHYLEPEWLDGVTLPRRVVIRGR